MRQVANAGLNVCWRDPGRAAMRDATRELSWRKWNVERVKYEALRASSHNTETNGVACGSHASILLPPPPNPTASREGWRGGGGQGVD